MSKDNIFTFRHVLMFYVLLVLRMVKSIISEMLSRFIPRSHYLQSARANVFLQEKTPFEQKSDFFRETQTKTAEKCAFYIKRISWARYNYMNSTFLTLSFWQIIFHSNHFRHFFDQILCQTY